MLQNDIHQNLDDDVMNWLRRATDESRMSVRQVPLRELSQWLFASHPLHIIHRSRHFFKIIGIHYDTTFEQVSSWDQPIIDQRDIGILGCITRVLNGERHFLMQAKVEPGNINGAQVSPTVQATRSNYSRVHGGRATPYLEYFVDAPPTLTVVDELQSEQASRFLHKRNRNMIVDVPSDIPVHSGFRWIPLSQIRRLLAMDNVINMDARSVLSCLPAIPDPRCALHPSAACSCGAESVMRIMHWFSRLRACCVRNLEQRGLDELQQWVVGQHEIHHLEWRHFSVIGVEITMQGREVLCWNQPLVKHYGEGLNGLIMQENEGVIQYLIRACGYPGSLDTLQLGPTVYMTDYRSRIGRPGAPLFFDYFIDPAQSTIRYSAVQSEEGGRFYCVTNRYMVVEPSAMLRNIPPQFCWATLADLEILRLHGHCNIELRNLLTCLRSASMENLTSRGCTMDVACFGAEGAGQSDSK